MKTLKLSFLLLSIILLASCGGGLSGTYVQANTNNKLTFSGHKVQVNFMGSITELDYEKDGDQVKLTSGDKNEILTIDKDGCIDGGSIMGKFCKQ